MRAVTVTAAGKVLTAEDDDLKPKNQFLSVKAALKKAAGFLFNRPRVKTP